MTYVQFERTTITFVADIEESLLPLLLGLRHYEVSRNPDSGSPIRLRVVKSEKPEVAIRQDQIILRIPIAQCSVDTLQMMVDLAYYRLLDETGIMILHASVVSDGTTTFGLWGGSGAGKTTTAVALRESAGFSVLSNGTAIFRLIEGIPNFVGTAKTHVKLRSSSVKSSGSSLASEFSFAPDDGDVSYEQKVERQLSDLADPIVRPPLPITAFYLLRLVRGLPDAQLNPVRPERAGVELYEDGVRHLHGLTAILRDEKGGRLARLPVLGTSDTHAMRRDLIAGLLHRAEMLSGPLDDVTRLLISSQNSHQQTVANL